VRLDPRRPALCVVQATITTPDGRATRIARSMPAAPFGTPAWQMPRIAGYLAKLRRAEGDGPRPETFTAYLDARGGPGIPSPHQPYAYTPWHDEQITCLIDLVLTPHGSMGWPGVSLVVIEQEAGRGRCSWNRMERHRGYLDHLAYTAREIAAEHARLANQPADDGIGELHALAGDVTTWVQKVHKAAKADRTLARAAQAREDIRRR
jgi:hypothetical protein